MDIKVEALPESHTTTLICAMCPPILNPPLYIVGFEPKTYDIIVTNAATMLSYRIPVSDIMHAVMEREEQSKKGS